MNVQKKVRRKNRVRAVIKRSTKHPRLIIFRSNRGLFAHIVDGDSGKTILGLSDKSLPEIEKGLKKSEVADNFGKEFAKRAREKNIGKVVFDRSGYAYHGRVKSFAEGARKGGLEF